MLCTFQYLRSRHRSSGKFGELCQKSPRVIPITVACPRPERWQCFYRRLRGRCWVIFRIGKHQVELGQRFGAQFRRWSVGVAGCRFPSGYRRGGRGRPPARGAVFTLLVGRRGREHHCGRGPSGHIRRFALQLFATSLCG